jgi:hypothetical protein
LAVYMSAHRQRRRMVGAAIAALLVGALLGVVIGRASAPGVDDAVSSSRSRGRSLASALSTLPFEYEQARAGAAGEDQARIESAVQIVIDMLPPALDKAPWLGPGARRQVTDAVDGVMQAVRSKVTGASMASAVETAVATVQDVFNTGTS